MSSPAPSETQTVFEELHPTRITRFLSLPRLVRTRSSLEKLPALVCHHVTLQDPQSKTRGPHTSVCLYSLLGSLWQYLSTQANLTLSDPMGIHQRLSESLVSDSDPKLSDVRKYRNFGIPIGYLTIPTTSGENLIPRISTISDKFPSDPIKSNNFFDQIQSVTMFDLSIVHQILQSLMIYIVAQ